jgi:hypothetical protein
MRTLAVLLLIPLIALTGCTRLDLTPPTPTPTSTGTVDTTPAAETTPEATEPTPDPGLEQASTVVPVSTKALNLGSYKASAQAKLLILSSHSITAIAIDGSVLETWVLPGDLRTLVEGVTHALGYVPAIVDHGPYSWDYDWSGFVITDYSPSVVGPGDPPYKFTATVRGIGVTQFRTVDDLGVGDPASMATSVADEVIDGSGYYWSSVDSFGVAVPGHDEARIYVEISAPSGAGNITEIRGPTGSWTS